MDISINLDLIEIGKFKRKCGQLEACIEVCSDPRLRAIMTDVKSALDMVEWKIDQTIMEEEGS